MTDQRSSDNRNSLVDRIRSSAQDPSKTSHLDALTNEKIADAQHDRGLKGLYAKGVITILAVQLLIMNAVFIATGVGCLHFEKWTLDLYMAGTLAEVFGIVLVITKNLFPDSK